MKQEPTICPDCGRNSEVILHKDGCPQFGKEVAEFIEEHEREIASWPDGARQALDGLNSMQAHLFGKQLRLSCKYDSLLALARDMAEALEHSYDAVEWPADGTSQQEKSAQKFREWEKKN